MKRKSFFAVFFFFSFFLFFCFVVFCAALYRKKNENELEKKNVRKKTKGGKNAEKYM